MRGPGDGKRAVKACLLEDPIDREKEVEKVFCAKREQGEAALFGHRVVGGQKRETWQLESTEEGRSAWWMRDGVFSSLPPLYSLIM